MKNILESQNHRITESQNHRIPKITEFRKLQNSEDYRITES